MMSSVQRWISRKRSRRVVGCVSNKRHALTFHRETADSGQDGNADDFNLIMMALPSKYIHVRR